MSDSLTTATLSVNDFEIRVLVHALGAYKHELHMTNFEDPLDEREFEVARDLESRLMPLYPETPFDDEAGFDDQDLDAIDCDEGGCE